MTRRLIILVGSFLLLLGAFGVYRLIAGGHVAVFDELIGEGGRTIQPGKNPGQNVEPEGGRGLWIESRDDRGRLQAIYTAARFDKREDGTYVLESPVVVRYQRNGQRLYIRGDRGEFLAERTAKGYDVRRGKLMSQPGRKVKIYLDTDAGRIPPNVPRRNPQAVFAVLEKSPKDLVRINVDDVEFDNDRQVLQTDSYLVIWSKDVDLVGRGLEIRWNENPRELRSLTIQEGQYMAVYNVSTNTDILSLPGSRRESESSATTRPAGRAPGKAAAAAAAPAAARGAWGAWGPGAALAAGVGIGADETELTGNQIGYLPRGPEAVVAAPAFRRPAGPAEPGSGGAAAPGSGVGGRPAAAAIVTEVVPDAPAGLRKNVYLAVFNGSVNVDYGQRRMHHARKLSLAFEWDGDARRLRRLREGPTTRPAGKAPATQPARRAAAAPKAAAPKVAASGGTVPSPGARAASRPATTAPAKAPDQPEPEFPLIITWTGPLTLHPVGYRNDPSARRYQIEARGQHVVLSDGNATAECEGFTYARPGQAGRLYGTKDNPVTLVLPQGQEIISPEITFDRTRGTARLTGPGRMTATSLRDSMDEFQRMSRRKPAPATQPAGQDVPVDEIAWGDSLDVAFEEVQVRRDDGSLRTRQFMKQAVFRGAVKLAQGRTGNYMQCPKLTVDMARDPTGRTVPTKALATSDGEQRVFARQQGSDILADSVTVTFAARTETKPPGKPGDKPEQVRRIRPDEVIAIGKVRVSDQRGDRHIVAEADRLVSQAEQRTAVLYGKPARISQGPNVLAGDEIHLAQGTESADVIGAGTLNFETARRPGAPDDEARKGPAPPPRPVMIAWTERMEYSGKFNRAEFHGGVQLRSDRDEMDCGLLRVLFEKVLEPDKKALGAGKGATPDKGAGKAPVVRTTGDGAPVLPSVTVRAPGSAGTDAAKTPADKGADSQDARLIGMEQYSRRRISQIIALKNVAVRSYRVNEEDPRKRMNRRLRLTAAEQLIYDLRSGVMSVLGPGTLVSEDYRPPRPREPGAAPASSSEPSQGNLDRPMQTLFQWTDSMQLEQQTRRVLAEGDVMMANRNGDKITLVKDLDIPPLPEPLPRGRITAMTCRKLMAQFAEPRKDAKAAAPGPKASLDAADKFTAGAAPREKSSSGYLDMNPRLGAPEVFRAEGKVNLKDGDPKGANWQVIGELVIYERQRDMVIIWGNLPGQPRASASIFHEDQPKGQSQNWSSPKILWYRENDKVITEEVDAGGVR